MADVVASTRIFEEVPVPRSQRTRKVLRFAAGQVVPEAEAKRLGVSADGTQKKVPLAETDPSGVIPLTQKTLPAKKTAAKKVTAKKAPAKKTAKASKATKKR